MTFLEAEQSRLGPSADRTSRYYRWEVRLTPDEVAAAIARYGSVGRCATSCRGGSASRAAWSSWR